MTHTPERPRDPSQLAKMTMDLDYGGDGRASGAIYRLVPVGLGLGAAAAALLDEPLVPTVVAVTIRSIG
jgi:hypothetical protein